MRTPGWEATLQVCVSGVYVCVCVAYFSLPVCHLQAYRIVMTQRSSRKRSSR